MEPDETRVRAVVGLGNPGRRYEQTRHNAGFMVVDALVRRWGLGAGRKAFGGEVFGGWVTRRSRPDWRQRVVLLKPHTYMNRSGQAVKGLVKFHDVACEDLLVVLDDLAIPPDRVRVRRGGSAGGHKGLTDVQSLLGTDEIPRLRVGVGEAPEYMDAADFVLKRMDEDERTELNRAVDVAVLAVEDWLFEPLDDVMGKYNGLTF